MIPAFAQKLLDSIPEGFCDDGCSRAPDWNFRWACRIHDWWYCTRAHPEGQMTPEWREAGDHVVHELIRGCLPSWFSWISGLMFHILRTFGGHAFNTCGPDPDGALPFQRIMGWCRHGLPRPDWMLNREEP